MATDALTLGAIAGAAAVAVTEPTLAILAAGAADMASFRPTRTDLVIIPTVVCAAPIAVFLAFDTIVSIAVPSVDWVVPLLAFGVLATMFAVPVFKHATKASAKRVLTMSLATAATMVLLFALIPVLRWPIATLFLVNIFAIRGYASSPAVKSLWRSAGLRNDKGVRDQDTGASPRLVVIIFDELPMGSLLDRDGEIDAALFPNFARIAGMSTWYRNTMTVSTDTRDAVPAMLTGRLPKRENLATAADHPDNLFTLLRDRYTINAWESITSLWPRSATPGAASTKLILEAWRHHLDYMSPRRPVGRWFGVGTLLDRSIEDGINFVRSLRPRDRPTFDLLHVLLPHRPWHYVSDGRDYEGRGVIGSNQKRIVDAAAIRVSWQRHFMQVQAADWLLGDVLDKLESIGELEDAVIFVASDHGVAIDRDVPPRTPTDSTYHQIGWVPFFVKRSGQLAGEVTDAPTITVDALPTLADALGIRVPWPIDGVLAGTRTIVDRIEIMDRSAAPLDMTSTSEPTTWSYDAKAGFAAVFEDATRREPVNARHGLYGFGPNAELVGKDVASLPIDSDSAPAHGHVAPLHGNLKRVKPNADRIPWIHLAGSVTGASDECEVAIAINGVVAGVAALRRARGEKRPFEIFAMPEAFRRGANDAALFLIRRNDGETRLQAVTPIDHRHLVGADQSGS